MTRASLFVCEYRLLTGESARLTYATTLRSSEPGVFCTSIVDKPVGDASIGSSVSLPGLKYAMALALTRSCLISLLYPHFDLDIVDLDLPIGNLWSALACSVKVLVITAVWVIWSSRTALIGWRLLRVLFPIDRGQTHLGEVIHLLHFCPCTGHCPCLCGHSTPLRLPHGMTVGLRLPLKVFLFCLLSHLTLLILPFCCLLLGGNIKMLNDLRMEVLKAR